VAHVVKPQKAHQQRELVCPVKEEAQKGERRLKRVEEKEIAYYYTAREFSVEI